jgi:hypothetical protein
VKKVVQTLYISMVSWVVNTLSKFVFLLNLISSFVLLFEHLLLSSIGH